jgi:predicted nuclease with TOPRIM domain
MATDTTTNTLEWTVGKNGAYTFRMNGEMVARFKDAEAMAVHLAFLHEESERLWKKIDAFTKTKADMQRCIDSLEGEVTKWRRHHEQVMDTTEAKAEQLLVDLKKLRGR